MSQNEIDLKEKLEIVRLGDEFERLVSTRGWQLFCDYQTAFIQKGMDALRKADTSKPESLDELRRWQIAVEFVEGVNDYIERTMADAKLLKGMFNMDDVLLMEKLKNEQSESRPDPAGY